MGKFDRKQARSVGKVSREFNHGDMMSSASGKPVKIRKQAIAIALSEARDAGLRILPRRRDSA
jgi:hypothetical protein